MDRRYDSGSRWLEESGENEILPLLYSRRQANNGNIRHRLSTIHETWKLTWS